MENIFGLGVTVLVVIFCLYLSRPTVSLTSNSSAIVTDLLFKSGAIRMASFVELWTDWPTYVGKETPKPSFKQLYETELKVVDASISNGKEFCKILQDWGFPPRRRFTDIEVSRQKYTGPKPTGILEIDALDQYLNEKRQEKKWISGPGLTILWHLTITPFLIFIVGQMLLLGPILSVPLIVMVWIVRIPEELDTFRNLGGIPRHALPIIKPLRKRLAANLEKWEESDLQYLAELVATLPTWGEESPATETIPPPEAKPEPPKTESVSAVPESGPPPAPEVKQPTKTKINAKAVVLDIRSGMDDIGLMQKYGLSAKQLTGLYKKLEEAGLLGKAGG